MTINVAFMAPSNGRFSSKFLKGPKTLYFKKMLCLLVLIAQTNIKVSSNDPFVNIECSKKHPVRSIKNIQIVLNQKS